MKKLKFFIIFWTGIICLLNHSAAAAVWDYQKTITLPEGGAEKFSVSNNGTHWVVGVQSDNVLQVYDMSFNYERSISLPVANIISVLWNNSNWQVIYNDASHHGKIYNYHNNGTFDKIIEVPDFYQPAGHTASACYGYGFNGTHYTCVKPLLDQDAVYVFDNSFNFVSNRSGIKSLDDIMLGINWDPVNKRWYLLGRISKTVYQFNTNFDYESVNYGPFGENYVRDISHNNTHYAIIMSGVEKVSIHEGPGILETEYITLINALPERIRYNFVQLNYSVVGYTPSECRLLGNNTILSSVTSGFTQLNYTFPDNHYNHYNFRVNCWNNSINKNSTAQYSLIDLDFISPSLNITWPPDGYTIYNISMRVESNESVDCFVNDSRLEKIRLSDFIFSFNETAGFDNELYHFEINCSDASGNTEKAVHSIRKDSEAPEVFIIFPSNSILYDAAELLIYFNASDNNMLYSYHYNITDDSIPVLPELYYSADGNLSGKNMLIARKINISEFPGNIDLTVTVQVCDAHTAQAITPAKAVIQTKDRLIYNFGNNDVEISSKTALNAETIKKIDRYEFIFEQPSEGLTEYELSTSMPLHYLHDSPYQAHFVSGDHWIDFEGDGKVLSVVPSKEIPNTYIITIMQSNAKAEFHSIGELNCASASSSFKILPHNYGIFYLNLNNITSYALLGILLVLYLGMLSIGLSQKIFIFQSLAVFFGIILGIFIINISTFLSVSIILGNAVFFVIMMIDLRR